MKLKFKNQQFQSDAVAAVVDLFSGQPHRADTFTIVNEQQCNMDAGLGIAPDFKIAFDDSLSEEIQHDYEERGLFRNFVRCTH